MAGQRVTASVKSPLIYDADITKALHQDGSWYLIPEEHCFMYRNQELDSRAFHVCRKSRISDTKTIKPGKPVPVTRPYTCHRFQAHSLKINCLNCNEPVPDSIKTLFLLHNWKYLSGKE
jgi:hypothetical protein